MKSLYPTTLILLCLILLGSAGCASIAKYMPWSDDNAQADPYENDPVAAAAMRLRQPASSPADGETKAWDRRYTPPAETISFGMGMDDVSSVWGEPSRVESAGDARDGNQRWVYYSGLSSRYGLGDQRIVYFENGRVVGWKK